eukprot:7792194-Alexandrium_andersonii.AAC.1
MSASLVGSEMCIRDSGLLATRRPRTCPGAPGPAMPQLIAGVYFAFESRCLLYTSDAADDM